MTDDETIIAIEVPARLSFSLRQIREYAQGEARKRGYILARPFSCYLEEAGDRWKIQITVSEMTRATGA